MRGIHRWPVNYPHKGPVTRKMFPFDDVIMGMTICRRYGINILAIMRHLTTLATWFDYKYGTYSLATFLKSCDPGMIFIDIPYRDPIGCRLKVPISLRLVMIQILRIRSMDKITPVTFGMKLLIHSQTSDTVESREWVCYFTPHFKDVITHP